MQSSTAVGIAEMVYTTSPHFPKMCAHQWMMSHCLDFQKRLIHSIYHEYELEVRFVCVCVCACATVCMREAILYTFHY